MTAMDPNEINRSAFKRAQQIHEHAKDQLNAIGKMGSREVKPIGSNQKGGVDKVSNVAQPIILLTGTSTAGKTTLIDAFSKISEKYEAFGLDEYVAPFFATKYPEDYQTLSRVMDDHDLLIAFNTKTLPQNGRGTIKQRGDAIKCLQKFVWNKAFNEELIDSHCKAVVERAGEGKPIVLDTPFTRQFFEYLQKHKFEGSVTHVIVYLPIEVLIKRVQFRNKDPSNHRDIGHLLYNFRDLYRPVVKGGSDIPIGTLSRDSIHRIFKDHIADFQDEKARGKRPPTEEMYLEHFGFEEGVDEVQIASAYKGRIDQILDNATEQLRVLKQ